VAQICCSNVLDAVELLRETTVPGGGVSYDLDRFLRPCSSGENSTDRYSEGGELAGVSPVWLVRRCCCCCERKLRMTWLRTVFNFRFEVAESSSPVVVMN
jgi:hypothetical protein